MEYLSDSLHLTNGKSSARRAWVLSLAMLCGTMTSAADAAKPWWEKIDPATLPAANLPMAEVIDRCIDQKLKQRDLMPALTAPLETRLRRLMQQRQAQAPTRGGSGPWSPEVARTK